MVVKSYFLNGNVPKRDGTQRDSDGKQADVQHERTGNWAERAYITENFSKFTGRYSHFYSHIAGLAQPRLLRVG